MESGRSLVLSGVPVKAPYRARTGALRRVGTGRGTLYVPVLEG